MKRYYSLYQNAKKNSADIYIYGDIASWEWKENDVSSYTLAKELQELDEDIENINVYISSYGGEVKEGLAIYKALKRHKAKITTVADGFACSIASVIFSAGDERVMSDIDLLMIHNAWTYAAGDANDFREKAKELEKVTQRSINAYMSIVNIDEIELKELMNIDTWIDGAEALEMGFATKLIKTEEKQIATQSVRNALFQRVTEESKKVAVANFKFDKEQMEEIVQRQIKELEQRLQLSQPDPTPEPLNKPFNMLKALFNNEEDK